MGLFCQIGICLLYTSSKGIDQIDCKTHCHHNSRNRKAKRRTPADAFFLKKLFLCKFRLCFFFFKYKAFAEHIVQDVYKRQLYGEPFHGKMGQTCVQKG